MSVPTPSEVFAKGDTPTLEYKDVGVSGFEVVDEEKGIVEAIVSVTGIVDNVNDNIKPGAYTKTLQKVKPIGCWAHEWKEPVSKTLDMKELLPGDPKLPATLSNGEPWPAGAGALWVKTQFNLDGARGKQAYEDVKFFGTDQAWSIGYKVDPHGSTTDTKSGVRSIDSLTVWEYSPVLHGAMPHARTLTVKDAQMAYKSITLDAAEVKEWREKLGLEEKTEPSEVEAVGGDVQSRVVVSEATEAEIVEPPAFVQPEVDDSDLGEIIEKLEEEDAKAFELTSDAEVKILNLYYSIKDILEDAGILKKDDRDILDDIPMEVWEEMEPSIKAFNSAAEEDDFEGLEESANAVLDIIEKNLGGADERTKAALMAVVDSLDEIFADEAETPEPMAVEDTTDHEEPVKSEMVVLELKDIAAYLD